MADLPNTTARPPQPGKKSTDEPTICIRGLNQYFGEGDLRTQILFDINLDIAPGEIVFILGHSGSGKTTLLTLIGTLRTVQQGSLRVAGQELYRATNEQILATRRKIGFIFQAHNLFGSLTAMQNVRMGMELFNISQKDMNHRAMELLTRLGLGERVYHKPRALSGGQKQRVAVARGLAHSPQLILADEPTAALDETSGREVMNLFQELAQEERRSIIVVTHDNRILDVPDRIVTLEYGKITSNVLVREASKICEFLSKCPVFAGFSHLTLLQAAEKMSLEEHPAGAVIFHQGDPGEKFYLIRQGTVAVVRDGKEIASLGEGDFFGETALIERQPRNATIAAKTDVQVHTLDDEDFQEVLKKSASFEEEIQKALFARR